MSGECGTTGGYQVHRRDKTPSCDRCREAHAAAARARRARLPVAYGREKQLAAAHSRALWRLAKEHPERFQSLVDDELAKAQSTNE